jgi:hypothetical protein
MTGETKEISLLVRGSGLGVESCDPNPAEDGFRSREDIRRVRDEEYNGQGVPKVLRREETFGTPCIIGAFGHTRIMSKYHTWI